MTISVVSSSTSATGNGSTTVFAYTFAALSDSEVAVKVSGSVVSTSLYSVARDLTDNQGGTVTFLTPPANGAAISIYSSPSFEQGADADNAGAFNLASLEEAFDRAAVRDIYIKGVIESGSLVGAQGPTGPIGPTGATGATGPTGATGAAGTPASNPSITYVINTLTAGSSATFGSTGTYPNVTWTFGIPRGDPGTSGALTNGTYSGIVVSGGGAALDVVAGHITLARMANLAANSILGNNTGSAATPIALTFAQVKTALAITQADVSGLTAALALLAPLASPALTGNPTVPTQATGDNSTKAASTAYVKAQGYATLAAPALTGAATIDGETIGFRHLPIVTKASSFTFALADDGKGHVYTGGAGTATIDPVGTTAYIVGTIFVGFVSGTNNLTVTRGSGVTLYKNGSTTSADVVVGPKGRFTLIHWSTNVWTIDGSNLT